MKLTPLDIHEMPLKKNMFGYDKEEIENFKETIVEAFTEASKDIFDLEDEIKALKIKLSVHDGKEEILKDTITTAQKMVGDLKTNAEKEAQLIVAEASQQADKIKMHAQQRVIDLQDDIQVLKVQRIELENSLESTLGYHTKLLVTEQDRHKDIDETDNKLKYLKTE